MAEHYSMNKQREAHMNKGEEHGGGEGKHPQIHIHSHSAGHTVHIMHSDGRHEKFEHSSGDADGIAQHIHDHLGSGGGDEEQEPEPQGFHDEAEAADEGSY